MDEKQIRTIILEAYQNSIIEFQADLERRLATIARYQLRWGESTGVNFAKAFSNRITNTILATSTNPVHKAVDKELS